MDILRRNYIAIDEWAVLFPGETTFLLTHLHTDHADIPKRFSYPVYTSGVTGILCKHQALRPILRINQWYQTYKHNVPFQVIDTHHTVESIGFYFPTLCVLYSGDCAEPIVPVIYKPLTIVYDGLYEDIKMDAPTPQESCKLIRNALETNCKVLQLVHHGILSFISSSCRIRFRLHRSLSDLIRNAAKYLDLEDKDSPYLLVGRSYEESERIVPSSYWFMRKNNVDTFHVHKDNDKFRVFCTLHALCRDIERYRELYPYAYFEKLDTKPL